MGAIGYVLSCITLLQSSTLRLLLLNIVVPHGFAHDIHISEEGKVVTANDIDGSPTHRIVFDGVLAEIVELQTKNDNLHNDIKNIIDSLQSKYENYTSLHDPEDSVSQDQSHELNKPTAPKFDLTSLDNALSIKDTELLVSNELSTIFAEAVDNLASILNGTSLNEHYLLFKAIEKRYSPTFKNHNNNHVCPSLESKATHEYVHSYIGPIMEALHRRTELQYNSNNKESPLLPGISSLVKADIMNSYTKKFEQREKVIKQKIKNKRHMSDYLSCIQPKDIKKLVDEGLESRFRKRDMRKTLSLVLNNVPITLTSVGGSSIPPSPKQFTSNSNDVVNLSPFIDTPLFEKSMQILDSLADFFSGYNEIIDRLIDTLADGNDDGHIGQKVGQMIIKWFEGINFPKRIVNLKKNAGVLQYHASNTISRKIGEQLFSAELATMVEKLTDYSYLH